MKCIACGSAALIEGTLRAEDGSTTGFQPNDTPFLKRIFAMDRREVFAYGCMHCQNLQLVVKFSERDFERYQEFEGQQPGVLDRIASEPNKPGAE